MSSLPRSAAYRAVLSSLQGKTFASQILEDWGRQAKPSTTDERFAREITYGAIRMARCLDFLAEKAAEKNKLRLGNREKALLRTAAYQLVFMDRTAAYAAVNESVQLAKTLGNPSFPGFLNAILRKLSTVKESLPKGNSVQDLGIRYSYPDVYVEQLLRIYPLQDVVEILEAGNRPSLTYARKRPSFEMEPVTDLNKTANSPEFYIQNPTPAALMVELCRK